MIKFFRNIRQKLLAENRISKYMVYAIGEIVLVVIGILIALQINNWNENRKDRDLEKYYLNQLLIEFQNNIKESEFLRIFGEFQSKNIQLLLKSLKQPLDSSEIEIWFFAVEHSYYLPHANYHKNVWNELKSTGKMEIIENKELINTISKFYSSVDIFDKLYEDEWNSYSIKHRDKINDLLPPDLRFTIKKKLSLSKIKEPLDSIPNYFPYLNKLKKIEGIDGDLVDIADSRRVSLRFSNSLSKKANNILEILNSELKKTSVE
ncbi:DUF6090 family protein [Seonamhaeicola maritimus]|uniref:DUF6090 family protein n=1 Tax=Seonamhaeicola maritimus TaxID=2591822 RepID=UPI0024958260|nr:DUF6090 family protein [Seonamhaeicola maritimus]